jgi:formylmethanofuran dehydrogenase subunit E
MTRNAQDIIDDMRNIVKPRIAEMLLKANFEGCGKEDKAEFETEFEMTLTLAEKALEQEPKTGRWEEVQFRTIPYNRISKAKKCSVCGKRKDKYVTWNYCPNCGTRMMER